jgi:hypothetical protein
MKVIAKKFQNLDETTYSGNLSFWNKFLEEVEQPTKSSFS